MSENLANAMKNVGKVLMNNIQMGMSYNWGNEFSYKEIKDRYESIKEQLKEMIGDITSLTADDLKELGFKSWDDDSKILLIPLWAFDLIPDGTELECIDGDKAIKGKEEIDLDVRFGCIAWGFEPKTVSEV